MKSILLSLLLSLVLTLAVELTVSLIIGIRSKRDLFIVALVNILTNPAVNYCANWAFYLFSQRSIITILIILALELGAVFVEFLIYRQLLTFDRLGKLKLSVLLNAASFLSGLAITAIIQFIS